MTNRKMINGFETITLTANDGVSRFTCVPGRGAALSSIIMPSNQGEKELLFLHDYFWDDEIDDLPGGLPVAFPVFARLERQGQRGAYLYNGKVYHLPIHGFSWSMEWQVLTLTDHQLTLQLTDTPATRACYPFSFEVTLTYEVSAGQLLCYQTYKNTGDQVMPFAFGFHPYFKTPGANDGKSDVKLDYQPTRRFIYNKTLTDVVGEGSLFDLPRSVADETINEQLTTVADDKTVHLYYPDGTELQLCAEGIDDRNLFPFIQLYTIPDKPFFCAEPITSPPNAFNTVSGMRWLEPGQQECGLLKLQLLVDSDRVREGSI